MSFHTDRHVKKARRAKACDWCREIIEKGAPSVVMSGVWDGDFFSGRYHPECRAAVDRWYGTNKCWGEEMPDWPMNRGGIEERGEPEESDERWN